MDREPILVDTGPLVALMSRSQRDHETCRATLATLRTPLLTCWPVLTETAYLLRRHPREVRALLASTDSGFLQILPLTHGDVPGINAILTKYEDQGFQLADAALMWLAERENVGRIFTLDRRDFSIYRTRAGKVLRIVPESIS